MPSEGMTDDVEVIRPDSGIARLKGARRRLAESEIRTVRYEAREAIHEHGEDAIERGCEQFRFPAYLVSMMIFNVEFRHAQEDINGIRTLEADKPIGLEDDDDHDGLLTIRIRSDRDSDGVESITVSTKTVEAPKKH